MGKVSRRAARLKARRLEVDINQGRVKPEEAPSLAAHCRRFIAIKSDTVSLGTIDLYRLTIRYLIGFFGGNARIDRISRADAADWRTALAGGHLAHVNSRNHGVPAKSTVCRSVRDAKSIFRMAIDEDTLPFNPFDRLRSNPPAPDKTWEYISSETLAQLLAACPSNSWRLLLGLCRLAGLRQGEAVRLQWSDIDLEARRLTIANPGRYRTTKRRTRQVPIAPDLLKLLIPTPDAPEPSQLVVNIGGTTNLWRDFRRILRHAALDP